MQRRRFLQKMGPIGGLLATSPAFLGFNKKPFEEQSLHPPYLQAGDFVGITCPAGTVATQNGRYAENVLKNWGFRVKNGSTLGLNWQGFAGKDEERAIDLQRQLDDPVIKAILFGRGGYGVMRIMDKINWAGFQKNPKWLIGFSDITAIHCHVNGNFGIPTIHGKMAMGFTNGDTDAELSVKNAIMGTPLRYSWPAHPLNRLGNSDGLLTGGNLSLIYAMQASPSELDTRNKILFIEDVGEYIYSVDRMLINLKRSGKLKHLAGLVVGGFANVRMEEDGFFTMSMEEVIFEKVKEYDFPVAFGFPAGHQKMNMALKFYMPYQLQIQATGCVLAEPQATQSIPTQPVSQDSLSAQAPLPTKIRI